MLRLFLALMMWILAGAAAQAQPAVITLSEADAQLYARAYTAAEAGETAAMERLLKRVEDDVLAAHVRGVRLADGRARPAYAEFVGWLRANGDQPISRSVRARALQLKPRRAASPPPAASITGRAYPLDRPAARASARERERINQAQLAMGEGRFADAEAILQPLTAGPLSGEAHWRLGLILHRVGDHAGAADAFLAAAGWPHFDAWNEAAALWWAGRSLLAAGDPRAAQTQFQRAARWPQTFYGQLAEAQLGRDSALSFAAPALTYDSALALIETWPEARRAAALAQMGRMDDAERELAWLHGKLKPTDDAVYLAFAQALNAPRAQLRAAEYGGPEAAAGHCPSAPFTPRDGFQLDRALVLAVTRQESRFDPQAISSSNARGLMQLLPSTAAWVSGDAGLNKNPNRLHEPGLNLQLGQAYLQELKAMVEPRGDLAQVLAAYNGGPNWLARWLAQSPQADPLLMLELMPRSETRAYAERALSHLTLCRKAMGQTPQEMYDLASGRRPVYRAQDAMAPQLAALDPGGAR